MKNLSFYIVCLILCLGFFQSKSQHSDLYMTKNIRKAYEKGTRDRSGNPGAKYWQNYSVYTIEAEFIPDSAKIIGYEKIDYYNNSKDTLKHLRFMLKQDLYKKGTMRDWPVSKQNVTDGASILEVIINGDTLNIHQQEKMHVFATRFIFRLEKSKYILPNSNNNIEVKWKLDIPKEYEVRNGRVNDSAFFVGYWFPQIVVYDDIRGWDNMFYTGIQETYNDVSDFDVKLKVSGDFFMWATGELQNPQDIYSTDFNLKVEKSKRAKEVIHLISEEDVKNKNLLQNKKHHVWHFKAEDVPDFAFGISNNYIWDATSVVADTANNKRTWVNVAYNPKEVSYKKVINWAKQSIEYFSKDLPGIPFPYNKHTTFLVMPGRGMEFPMIAANGSFQNPVDLADVTSHEIAHNYFPFYVCTNEEKYGWMDEGWTSFLSFSFVISLGLDHTKSEFYFGTDWNTENDIPLITPSNYLHINGYAHNYYIKPLKANNFLFEIFESKGLPHPLKEFMTRWKHKHPVPYDYFFTMEELLGEDLSWYWKPWYFDFCSPDLEIESVEQTNKNVEISIVNSGKMPLPVDLKVELEDGEILKNRETAYVWKNNSGKYTYTIKTKKKVSKITLGNKDIPDVTPENNTWNVNKNLEVRNNGN